MEPVRSAFQGVSNIVRFNWHFFVSAGGVMALLLLGSRWLPVYWQPLAYLLSAGIALSTLVSLAVSYYVYDWSALYQFNWLRTLHLPPKSNIVNVHAGFDETSALLSTLAPDAQLTVLDFYDPAQHTEVSIKRARKAYPPFPGTQSVVSTALPVADASVDAVFGIFAVHEIRDAAERKAFFAEMTRILKPNGQLIIVEHLRDWPNFLAYNIGFLHFYPKSLWTQVFTQSKLTLTQQIRQTPFVSVFILRKDGSST